MTVFVDTSALMAFLVAEDRMHANALLAWERLLREGDQLVTSNYVVVEACVILHRRFGTRAVRSLIDGVLPAVMVQWVDVAHHKAGVAASMSAEKRGPNLVDCVSFEVMRTLGIRRAFAFDHHFRTQGFETIGG